MQLTLTLRPVIETRVEVPASRTSWRDGDQVIDVRTYAHSIDTSWSFWRPFPVEAIGVMTRTRL